MEKRIGLVVLAGVLAAPPAWADGSLVRAARSQIGQTVSYDPAYRRLGYPNGDVPADRGVCTDVVIRALRGARRVDLQRLVHEDMTGHFARYPKLWGLARPDRNIDHRRVPNLQVYFTRQGWSLPVSRRAEDYKAGDLVTVLVPPRLPHIMIVSDKQNAGGRPLVIHNIGAGTREEDRLFEFEITGHYRIPARSSHALSDGKVQAAGVSCRREIGAGQAKVLVRQCIQVSPATHPPCNASNSCDVIKSEIKRGCALLEKEPNAPKFCKSKRLAGKPH